MTIYYSNSTNGFYDTEIHSSIPGDAVEIASEEHRSLLQGQSEGKIIGVDETGRPTLFEPAEPTLEEYRDQALENVDILRSEKEREGMAYMFGELEDVIQLRSDKDVINIQGLVSAAQLAIANNVTDTVFGFRAASNQTHRMTPMQVLEMGVAVSTHISSLYAVAWDMKEAVKAAETKEEIDLALTWPVDPA